MERLGKDPRSIILEQADPITVLQLCQTDTSFASICNRKGFFEKLLTLHYPDRASWTDFDSARDAYNFYTYDAGLNYQLRVEPIAVSRRKVEQAYMWVDPVAHYLTPEEAFEESKLQTPGTSALIISLPGSEPVRDTWVVMVRVEHDYESAKVTQAHAYEILDDAIDEWIEKPLNAVILNRIEEFRIAMVDQNIDALLAEDGYLRDEVREYVCEIWAPSKGYPNLNDEQAIRDFIEEKRAFHDNYTGVSWMFVDITFE